MKKVVLITTGQPAINPRLVKEANSLSEAGYDVTVLYCYFIAWASQFDNKIFETAIWKHSLIGGSPTEQPLLYFVTRLRFKLARWINFYLNGKLFVERAQARAFDELLKASKNIKADLFIGHNLGAMAVAVKAAKFHKTKAGFDYEDYHLGELMPGDKNVKRIFALERKYVPQLAYFTTSSPLILKAVNEVHPTFQNHKSVLLNCFSLRDKTTSTVDANTANKLKLFWFSQTIGKNRGLETVLAALAILNKPDITLDLVGRCDNDMLALINQTAGSIRSNINFAGLLAPSRIANFASQFDIGLATEKNEPFNRDICLTNKIFAYLLSGLCIVASNTTAQAKFLEDHPRIGKLYKCDDPKSLAAAIESFYNDRDLLLSCKMGALSLGNTEFNWEKEDGKFKCLIRKVIKRDISDYKS